jgi:hypothetical protein
MVFSKTHVIAEDGTCQRCGEAIPGIRLLANSKIVFVGERIGVVVTPSTQPVAYVAGANDTNEPCGGRK